MLQPPRGTRDLLPPETIIKQKIIDRLRAVFELYGFDPVESPAIETWDTLSRKAGTDIERQIYRFKDKSGRDLGLRFDLTVPLARILSSRLDLPMPFKRYQIGPVWRYEEVKAGRRYREFWQADADIVGVSGIEADAEILAVGIDGLMAIGIKDFYIRLNSRAVLERLLERLGVPEGKFLDVCRALDKLDKFSKDAVAQELKLVGLTEGTIKRLFSLSTDMLRKYKIDTTELDEMKRAAREWGFADKIKFDLNLARGLDYYTNIIFEFYVKGQEDIGAIAAGGRYDKLIGLFSKRPLPATGISFGIDRILGLVADRQTPKTLTQLFVAIVKPELRGEAIALCQRFRQIGIKAQIDLKFRPLSKQLEYADMLGIPYVLFLGPEEMRSKKYKIRDMASGAEHVLDFPGCAKFISKSK